MSHFCRYLLSCSVDYVELADWFFDILTVKKCPQALTRIKFWTKGNVLVREENDSRLTDRS